MGFIVTFLYLYTLCFVHDHFFMSLSFPSSPGPLLLQFLQMIKIYAIFALLCLVIVINMITFSSIHFPTNNMISFFFVAE
jgi:hypothetical protein